MARRNRTGRAWRAAGSAVLAACALSWGGCAFWQARDEFAAAKQKSDEPQLRPRGQSDLPFWYSSKSRDIEESLGGAGQ